MKITKAKLKQIIKEEISAVTEDKQAHISGITKKIARLKQAITNAAAGMKNLDAGAVNDDDMKFVRTKNDYTAKQEEVMNLRDKLEVLEDQLQQLQQDSPGQLARGLEEESEGHPSESDPGHSLVIDANNKLWEAANALDTLTDLIDDEGIEALGSMHVGTTIEDVRSKIRRINQLAEYLK